MRIITAILIFLAAATTGATDDGAVTNIGAILPLTGDFAFVGAAIQRGTEMRLREGGDRVKFIFEDDKTYDRKTIVSAFRKLTSLDKVPLLFVTAAPSVEPITALISSARIPTVAIWDFNKSIHNPREYKHSIGFSNEQAGSSMAEGARKKLKLSRVATITANDEWSEVVSEAFIKKFEDLGGKIDVLGRIDLHEPDTRALILRAKKLQSQAIFFPLYLNSLSSVVRQARELRYQGLLLTGEGMTEADVKTLGQLADKVYFQRIWVEDSSFREKYRQFTGETKQAADIGFVGLGYDMASLALEVIDSLRQEHQPITSEEIQKRLLTMQFQGITGAVDFATFEGKTLATMQFNSGKIVAINDGK
jgi:branched-chain amino acid transport system substrate-binding protein